MAGKSQAEQFASSRDTDKEAAFADKWRERYFDEKYLPEKQAFLKSRGLVWGEKDKEESHEEMERLEKNPSIWQAWMEHHADYAKIYNEHYERNGLFQTTSKTHDDGDDEDLDGDKPRRGRTVNKAPDISAFGGLKLDDQALVETQVKLVAAVRKMRKYMRTNTDELKEKYATVIELLRKDQATLIVAAENPDEFKKLFDNYLENGVVGDPRKLFIDSERNEQAYTVIKNLKGGQKM